MFKQTEDPPPSQQYLEKRAVNNQSWANQACLHGSSIAATASTNWVRGAVLRRLRRIVKSSCRTLEVGCGNASSLLGPLSRNCQAYGADLTMEMLSLARHHHRINGLVRCDACYLPFTDESFDVVYTSRCLINVLDREMQRVAIRELFRVARRTGIVVLIENFEEPVSRLDEAKRRYNAGPPVIDDMNLRLNLDATIEYCRSLDWHPISMQGNTMTNFAVQIVLPKLIGQRGSQAVEAVLYPLCILLTLLDEKLGSRLPLLGKDVMVVFRRR